MNIAVNKIDIERVRYHLSRVRVTIVWSLWRHRRSIVTSSAERNASEWDTGIMCEYPCFSVIYGFVMSSEKYNNVCTLETNCLCTHPSAILVFISLVAAQTREINTKITLSWAYKQFATRVHTLFSMYIATRRGCLCPLICTHPVHSDIQICSIKRAILAYLKWYQNRIMIKENITSK